MVLFLSSLLQDYLLALGTEGCHDGQLSGWQTLASNLLCLSSVPGCDSWQRLPKARSGPGEQAGGRREPDPAGRKWPPCLAEAMSKRVQPGAWPSYAERLKSRILPQRWEGEVGRLAGVGREAVSFMLLSLWHRKTCLKQSA